MAKILFDFDGVLVRSRLADKTFLWQRDIEADLGLTQELRAEIFRQPDWQEIVAGRMDFRERLEEVFRNPKINIHPEELIRYWLSKDMNWYPLVLQLAKELKKSGHQVYIGTNQDKIRSAHIKIQNEVSSTFEQVFASCDLGVCKPDSEFYSRIATLISPQRPEEILVVDDDPRNIRAAKQAGMVAIYFNPDAEESHNANSLRGALMAIVHRP